MAEWTVNRITEAQRLLSVGYSQREAAQAMGISRMGLVFALQRHKAMPDAHGWWNIHLAPKDGTELLLFDNGDKTVGKWEDGEWFDGIAPNLNPTKFQYLPEDPL
jgi:hypothetical protein